MVIDSQGNELKPAYATPPGLVIKDEMRERGLKKMWVAGYLKLSIEEFKDLLKGDYSIDEKIAERLQDLFGIDADYWIKLQRNYDRMISEGKPKLKI